MHERPPLLRIDDLDAPQFSDEVAAIRQAVAAMADQVELQLEAVIAEAVEKTGLYELDADEAYHERLEVLLQAAVRDRDLLPADRSIEVVFHKFMADDLAMVERVYELAGQPLPDSQRRAMADYFAEHPRGRYGAIAYDAAELGLDSHELRERFRFSTDRFPVQLER